MSEVAAKSSSHLVVRKNALWNVFGLGIPLAVAFFFIPQLIEGMGPSRFGVLTLILAFLNYFGLFDLGIGRALTQILASGDRDEEEEAALVWTVSIVLCLMGVVAGAALFFGAPFITAKMLRIQDAVLGHETMVALRQLAFVIPFLLHSLALRGILEARRRFDLSNLVRVPVVVFTFGAPFLVLPFSSDLRVIVPFMLSGRIVAWILNFGMVLRIMPHVRRIRRWKPGNVRMLIRMGGWYTVSSVAAPLLDNMDRFFISAFLSVTMVAYYTTPYELIIRLGIISGGIGGAMFPEFASRLKKSPADALALFKRGFRYLLAILFPFSLLATAYAHEGLTLWLNPQFADLSAPVLQWLALFVFVTGAALVPFLFLGGAGRPELAARVHLIELPVLAALLYFFIKWDGIRGAAIACVLRIFIDFFGMLFFSGRILGFTAATYARILIPLALGISILLGFHFPIPALPKLLLTLTVLCLYAWVVWAHILEPNDKAYVRRMLGRKHHAAA